MGQSENQKLHWLDKLKIIIEIIVIVLMVSGLCIAFAANRTSRRANKIALDAFRNSYVPWLSVTGVELLPIDANNFKIAIRCKNFSNAPALKLEVQYDILGETVSNQIKLYHSDALMPNDERSKEVKVSVEDGRAEQIIQRLKSGECAIDFRLRYEDIFGRNFLAQKEVKYIDGVFRTTKYQIDGIDALFDEISGN